MIVKEHQQWAVEYPSKGVLIGGFASGYYLDTGDTKEGSQTLAAAEQSLRTLKRTYEDLGMPHVGKLLRIVSRTVTITYPDYQPLDPSYEELERNSQ